MTSQRLAALGDNRLETGGDLSGLKRRHTKTLLPTASTLLRPEVVDAKHTKRDIAYDICRPRTTNGARPPSIPFGQETGHKAPS